MLLALITQIHDNNKQNTKSNNIKCSIVKIGYNILFVNAFNYTYQLAILFFFSECPHQGVQSVEYLFLIDPRSVVIHYFLSMVFFQTF